MAVLSVIRRRLVVDFHLCASRSAADENCAAQFQFVAHVDEVLIAIQQTSVIGRAGPFVKHHHFDNSADVEARAIVTNGLVFAADDAALSQVGAQALRFALILIDIRVLPRRERFLQRVGPPAVAVPEKQHAVGKRHVEMVRNAAAQASIR